MACCTSSEGWGWCLRSTFAVAHGLRTIHIIWIYVRTAKTEASQSGEDSVMLCLLLGGIAVIGINMRTQPPRGFGLDEEYGDPPHACWRYWRIGDLRGRNIRVLWFLRLEKARGHGLCFFFIWPVFFTPLFLHMRSYDTTTGGILSLVFYSFPLVSLYRNCFPHVIPRFLY